MTDPRAYTAEELRDELLDAIRSTVRYWATLPDVDRATGNALTVEGRCEGVAFSILTLLDGCSHMPAFDLVAQPHPDDKAYFQSEGENWIEPGTTISEMLHDYFHTEASHD